MQANIKGLVDPLDLSQTKAMMPLYDAISNEIDSTKELQDAFSNHLIRIRLVVSNDLARQAGDGSLVGVGFDVVDDGGITDIDGRQINSTNLRYTGYQIVDLTPLLDRQVYCRYHRTNDNEGHFSRPTIGNGYIEILSYDKLVKDAARRNRLFFDKLGLHKN